MSDVGFGDFEFERRFFVKELPPSVVEQNTPNLILQSYFLADAGYAIRVRAQATGVTIPLSDATSTLEVIEEQAEHFEFAMLTAKGPMISGTRYEAERELDVSVAIEMIKRHKNPIIKNRYSLFFEGDGWSIDVFGGENSPLIIAECERGGPVVDLVIPSFCYEEVTNDSRFSNDHLAKTPYKSWQASHEKEMESNPPSFLENFGVNRKSASEF